MQKGKVDIERIRRYVNGELSPREMYVLERRAQQDPALMDVILGMERETRDVHAANLAAIRKRIAARAQRSGLRRLVPAQRWAIAATVLVAFTVGTLWFTQWQTLEENQPEIASAPAGTEAPRTEEQAIARKSDDQAEADDTATKPLPPSIASAAKKTVPQTKRRLAAGPTTAPVEQPTARDIPPTHARDTSSPSVRTAATLRPPILVDTAEVRQTAHVLRDDTPEVRTRGMRQTAQTVSLTGPDSLPIATQPDARTHSEVAGMGYGNESNLGIGDQPEPLGGWRVYNRYLKKGIRQTEGRKGAVTLTFTIDDEGSPIDIQITHTTHPALSKRAMELVREGPKWKPGKNGERQAELQVKF